MAQIINITSEALQATIRRLLPSQQGFGEDLQASNVIQPIIDLTPTAEGSVLPTYLQTALAFGSQTQFTAENTNVQIANSPGFYRVFGSSVVRDVGSAVRSEASLFMSDGSSFKLLWENVVTGITASTTFPISSLNLDVIVFLQAGESLTASSNAANTVLSGSIRQVATVTGELVNPSGYVSQ